MLRIDPSRGMEDPILAFVSRAHRLQGGDVVSQELPDGVSVSYDPCTFMVCIRTDRYYVFDVGGMECKRMVVIRLDLRVRDYKDAEEHDEGVSADFQPYHREYKLRKCCRVHIDLGPKLDSEGRVVSEDGEKDYLCMLLNIASARPRAFGGGAVDAPREFKKRAAPSGCDGFDSD